MKKIAKGTYAHRFQGHALDQFGTNYYLAGLGYLKISENADGSYTITGQQETVLNPHSLNADAGKLVKNRQYELYGRLNWNSDKIMWVADIKFTGMGEDKGVILKGGFVFSETGTEKQFWLMSTSLEVIGGKNVIPAEAVSGEAHWIG